MLQSSKHIKLSPSPLTAEAFEPFGTVIEHCGDERRHMVERNFHDSEQGLRQALWVSRFTNSSHLPIVIDQLERHPHSNQAFIPLRGKPYLVVCCADRADGSPDLISARAFVANPHQGVVYSCNVWHAGLQVLDAPAEFAVVMAMTEGCDDIILNLETPLHIGDSEARSEGRL